MAYEKLADYIRVTDDHNEMVALGRRIAADYKEIYTPLMMEKMYEGVESYIPAEDPEWKEEMVFRSIYDFWVYGCNVNEEFYLHFNQKTDAEKREYLVDRMRYVYINHLNSGGGSDRVLLLEDKYKLYRHLQPYYLRDVIEISQEDDFPLFESFVKKHREFVVKPSNFYYGIGVHKVSLNDCNTDIRTVFENLLKEAAMTHERHPSQQQKMVLEELIEQDESLAMLHPSSVNAIRATAVKGADGNIHLFHPWIKVGVNGTFVASAALDGFDAEIDPETGIVITDGYQESGNVYSVHPNSGITIKGFQIPKWNELLALVDELMAKLPEYRYIGWDLVLTPKGWCVMEGNYSAEFTFQLINNRGYKKEFEELIGWSYSGDYWWQDPTGEYGK